MVQFISGLNEKEAENVSENSGLTYGVLFTIRIGTETKIKPFFINVFPIQCFNRHLIFWLNYNVHVVNFCISELFSIKCRLNFAKN